jgi:predicted dehydrogenase
MLKWGILGPGNIARRFATQLPASATGRLSAVASRDAGRAGAFAREFGAEAAYGSYAELLADPAVDAVYIATPHPQHAAWTVRAAEAGKHILCEKPLAVNHASALAGAEAARANGVVLLEAYMYRFHPQVDTLIGLLQDGAVGTVQHVDASFSFAAGGRQGRLFDESLGGGGILDVGGYPVSMARLVASTVLGRQSEPLSLTARGAVGPTNVDEWAAATLQFDGGITAHVRCGISVAEEPGVSIYGSHGIIRLHTPWIVEPSARPVITVSRAGKEARRVECEAAAQYAREADALAAAVGAGDVPRMTVADALANLQVLDRWRAEIGLRYTFEG